ncbi:Putative ribonuclease H protein At1g65750 [Linum perenne]
MTPPSEERGPDDWVWGLEASGQFSIKSAYNLICNTDRYPESTVWKGVWKWVGPNRIKHFLRLAANNKLLTNVARRSRGLSADELCSRCGTEEETCIHVLRDCDFAKATWTEVGGFDINGDGWKQRATDWFNEYLGSKESLRFGIMCWYLWKARNERLFAGSLEGASGSVVGGRSKAAAGGILRDEAGRGIEAFAINLGNCSITRAEIRGALHGIRLAWLRGFRKVEVQIDSQAVVAILLDTSTTLVHQHAIEVLEFRDWLEKDWELKVKHIYREANQAADYLANKGHRLARGYHSVPLLDCNLVYYIRHDCMGISVPRLVH